MKLPQTWFSSRHQNCCSLYRDHVTVTNKSLFDIMRTTKVRFCSAAQVRSQRSFDFWHMASENYTSSRVINGFVKWFLCDFQWWFTTLLFGNSEITFCFQNPFYFKIAVYRMVANKQKLLRFLWRQAQLIFKFPMAPEVGRGDLRVYD